MDLNDKNLWEDLLLAIEESSVVPIVGGGLLTVDSPNGPRLFHQLVAGELAKELKVPTVSLRRDFETNDVVCAYDRFHGDPSVINSTVVRIVKNLKIPVPDPLRWLAEIPNFRLFISTTMDTLLEDAITSVRGRPPAVASFPATSKLIDYDDATLEQQGSMVFQILGRISALPKFAVTEGQMLEQMHDFMTGKARPERLIEKLQQSHLLVLGVEFPDWLARFLLRLARAQALWAPREMMEIIADSRSSQSEFASFLFHFSPLRSHIFMGGSPVDFVRELNRQWLARHPKSAAPSPVPSAEVEPPAAMSGGSVFISYAHEDRPAAFHLADALSAKGLEVWVDRRLNCGDDYNRIIERHIRECCAFVAVISRNTQNDDDHYWRRERYQAVERNKSFFGADRPFLFPVVVDDIPMDALTEVRSRLFERTALYALAGEPSVSLVQQLDLAQKAYRKQFSRV